MLMSVGLSVKVAFPVSTAGPVGIWEAEGAENSQIIFSAMTFDVDGAGLTGVVADRRFRGGVRRDRTVLRIASGSSTKFVGNSKPVIHYPVSYQRETKEG